MRTMLFLVLIVLLEFLGKGGADQRPLVVFQFLEESFLPIWHNWAVLALELGVLSGEGVEYHLSCFGSASIDERVKRVYSPGCSSVRTSPDGKLYKRIYLVKWKSFVAAFISEKKDMLLIDLDALLLKDPRSVFSDHSGGYGQSSSFDPLAPSYDIISSTDHGHAAKHFPYSHNWGGIRLCTGFVLLRYSLDMINLLNVVLSYQKVYGQGDQIAFNNVLARFGVIWKSEVDATVNEGNTGELLWFNQSDVSHVDQHSFVSKFAESKTVEEYFITRRMNIKLLPHRTVMRYCDRKGENDYDIVPRAYTSLHCYDSTRVPSGGLRRSHRKAFFFQVLGMWVLKVQYTPSFDRTLPQPGQDVVDGTAHFSRVVKPRKRNSSSKKRKNSKRNRNNKEKSSHLLPRSYYRNIGRILSASSSSNNDWSPEMSTSGFNIPIISSMVNTSLLKQAKRLWTRRHPVTATKEDSNY